MKHQYIQEMFMHLVYHFNGILVNQLYTCTDDVHTIINVLGWLAL